MKTFKLLANISEGFLIVGGLNIGILGVSGVNLVGMLLQWDWLMKVVYVVGGLSALYLLIYKLVKVMK